MSGEGRDSFIFPSISTDLCTENNNHMVGSRVWLGAGDGWPVKFASQLLNSVAPHRVWDRSRCSMNTCQLKERVSFPSQTIPRQWQKLSSLVSVEGLGCGSIPFREEIKWDTDVL